MLRVLRRGTEALRGGTEELSCVSEGIAVPRVVGPAIAGLSNADGEGSPGGVGSPCRTAGGARGSTTCTAEGAGTIGAIASCSATAGVAAAVVSTTAAVAELTSTDFTRERSCTTWRVRTSIGRGPLP